MVYEFEAVDAHSVRLGKHDFGLKVNYGLDPSIFLDFYQHLAKDYGLKLNKIEFEAPVLGNKKKKGLYRPIREYVNFIIYCNILERKGLDIKNLVRQIKPCKDLMGICHANSLAILAYIYTANGYNIEFLHDGADFLINYIKADVKVREPQVIRELKHTRVNTSNLILLPILKRISSGFIKGCKQANLLFFDMSNEIEFGLINFGIDLSDKIVEPCHHRLVFYKTNFFPTMRTFFFKSKIIQ
jgi:hypothetical protein